MRIHDYRGLIVWQKSVDLTQHVYELVRRFPAEERYALSSQMRRAATSVASNIAEGNAFFHRARYIRYLGLARGSLFELGTQIEIAARQRTSSEPMPLLSLRKSIRLAACCSALVNASAKVARQSELTPTPFPLPAGGP